MAGIMMAAGALPLPKVNPFVSPPPNPKINDPPPKPIPPPPITIPASSRTKPPPPALKSFHRRTKYHKPIPSSGVISSEADGRSVVLGDSGVSYLLPGAPFEFQFSYSEIPKAQPIAIREPAFLPFAPPTMPRPWTGKAPLDKSKKNKKLAMISPLRPPDMANLESDAKVFGVRTPLLSYGRYEGRTREEILGHPLTRKEIRQLVRPHLSSNRQLNLGRDGLTHNMLEMVHTHWRRNEVCKVRCRGVPTVDMGNICRHLEDKTGGKIIYRIGGIVYLFRGRNYDHQTRPQYPIMLWKPAAPVYPKLIQEAPEGLTKAEADQLRKKGQDLLPICKLAKNGIYISLVKDVRHAFESSSLVKINCQGMHASDYKKLGAKLKELVPCVLLSFDQEQILMWRGRNWKSIYTDSVSHVSPTDSPISTILIGSGSNSRIASTTEVAKFGTGSSYDSIARGSETSAGQGSAKLISSPKMMSLWKRAIESNRAFLLNEIKLGPDDLLQKVEEFESLSQATEHSFPAVIVQSGQDIPSPGTKCKEDEHETSGEVENEDDYIEDDDFTDEHDYDLNSFVPLGSLPVDSLAKPLDWQ